MSYTNDSQMNRVIGSEGRKRGGSKHWNAIRQEWASAHNEYSEYKETFEGVAGDLPQGVYLLDIAGYCTAIVRLNTLSGFIKRIQNREDYPRMTPSHKLARFEICLLRKCEPFERMLLC